MHAIVIFIAKYLFLVPVAVLVGLFFTLPKQQKIDMLVIGISGGLLCLILAKLGNRFIIDLRPFIRDGVTPLFKSSTDNGFPSDHALLSFFVSFVALKFNRRVGLILLMLAALVSWARVYSGVHHLYDVIGSFAIAAVALAFGLGVKAIFGNKAKSPNSLR